MGLLIAFWAQIEPGITLYSLFFLEALFFHSHTHSTPHMSFFMPCRQASHAWMWPSHGHIWGICIGTCMVDCGLVAVSHAPRNLCRGYNKSIKPQKRCIIMRLSEKHNCQMPMHCWVTVRVLAETCSSFCWSNWDFFGDVGRRHPSTTLLHS